MKKVSIKLLALVLFIMLHSCTFFNERPTVDKMYRSLPIASLIMSKEESSSGVFLLGIGTYESSTKVEYVVYGKFNRGLKRLTFDSENVFIQESDTIPPQIKNYYVKRWCNGKWLDWKVNYKNFIIVVPTNTIYKEFTISE